MLKMIHSMADLDSEQLLDIYKEHAWDELDFLSYLQEDFFQQPNAVYAVWVEGADYKSAVRLEQCGDGLLLHSLETNPGDRRRGYAYNLLSGCLDYLQTTNYQVVYSHIDKRNRASLNLHKKCGFQLFSDFARYIDGTVTQNSCTMYYQLKK